MPVLATAKPQIASSDSEAASPLRPEISRIIKSGREHGVSSGSAKPVLGVTALSCVLLWISFTPLDFAPAAWVALVPLCLLLRVRQLPRFSYRLIMLCGFVWALATLQWMRLGHWTMYGGLLALSFYLSMYFPVFVFIGRRLAWAGWPVWLAVPVVWSSLEYLRAYLFTGFSWYYLAHTQYQWTSLIQISDITGAYGVTFLIALASAAIAECIPDRALLRLGLAENPDNVLSSSLRQRRTAVGVSCGLVVLTLLYGVSRIQAPADAPDGPVIAVVQGNFTPELKHDPDQWLRMVREHDLLTRRAAGLRPDLIVWPETMFPVPDQIIGDGVTDSDLVSFLSMQSSASNSELAKQEIERWHSGYARELLVNRCQEAGAALLVGLLTEVAEKTGRERYNSAAFIRPDVGYVGRYDKMHRVVFGEYIPLRSVLPWLAKLTPFSAGFGINAGTQPGVFEYGNRRYSPIICFEDTVPQLVRRTVNATDSSGQTPDVLINMTNDGWFRGSSELDQHLITAVFRCVENRRPMVRAVNAGISAYIDSSGRIREPEHFWVMNGESAAVTADFERVESMYDEETGQRRRQCSAVMCGQVPLDGRTTLYSRFGDWFAILCSLATIVGLLLSRIRVTGEGEDPTAAVSESVKSAA